MLLEAKLIEALMYIPSEESGLVELIQLYVGGGHQTVMECHQVPDVVVLIKDNPPP